MTMIVGYMLKIEPYASDTPYVSVLRFDNVFDGPQHGLINSVRPGDAFVDATKVTYSVVRFSKTSLITEHARHLFQHLRLPPQNPHSGFTEINDTLTLFVPTSLEPRIAGLLAELGSKIFWNPYTENCQCWWCRLCQYLRRCYQQGIRFMTRARQHEE